MATKAQMANGKADQSGEPSDNTDGCRTIALYPNSNINRSPQKCSNTNSRDLLRRSKSNDTLWHDVVAWNRCHSGTRDDTPTVIFEQ